MRESLFQRYSTGELDLLRRLHELTISFKNEYGLQVKMPAKPTFPVEYLFVNVRPPSSLFQAS
jgi:hypothetical protein